MKKAHKNHPEQHGSARINSGAEVIQSSLEYTLNALGGQKQCCSSAVMYEKGDLRGIVAEALAKSTDPYQALSEAGVIKSAAEFFDDGAR